MLDVLVSAAGQSKASNFRLVRDENGYERVVYAEVIIPEYLNTYNDYYSEKAVREFAYAYMIHGFSVDLEHSGPNLTDEAFVVESFVARDNDPDFIPGSWVIGVYIPDDTLWEKVLNREINGFSYRADVDFTPVEAEVAGTNMFFGTTEPDPLDGHQHRFFIITDADGKLLSGGTDETNDHEHPITRHTFTGMAAGHKHVFNYAKRIGEI